MSAAIAAAYSLVGIYASRKGRSGGGFFFLSLLLSPLIGFVCAAAAKPNMAKRAINEGMKKCPFCAEFARPEARICWRCQHEFPAMASDFIYDSRQDGTTGNYCTDCGARFETAAAKASHFCNPR